MGVLCNTATTTTTFIIHHQSKRQGEQDIMFVKDQEYKQLPNTKLTLWYGTEIIFPQWFEDSKRPKTFASNELVTLPTLVYQGAFKEGRYKKHLFIDKNNKRYTVSNYCKNYFLNAFSGPVNLLPEKKSNNNKKSKKK